MNTSDRTIIHMHLNEMEDRLRGQELTQPEAEEIYIRMQEIIMVIRAGIKPIDIKEVERSRALLEKNSKRV